MKKLSTIHKINIGLSNKNKKRPLALRKRISDTLKFKYAQGIIKNPRGMLGKIPWNKDRKTIKCVICSKNFEVPPSRENTAKLCSKNCFSKFMKMVFNGANHPCWKGGRYRNTQNYILIYQPNHPFKNSDGYVREHRLVMEKKLKRYLKPKEQVHHINRDTSDNRIENLMLFSSNSKHIKFHVNLRQELLTSTSP